ncbi:unnamed protein product [Cunninghamella blakesleeana]
MTLTNLENTLLYAPGSLFSNVAVLTLTETKNLDKYELRAVDLAGKSENNSPEFIKLNKLGLVPVLVVNQDHTVPDSLDIAKFLDVDGHLKSNDNEVIEQVEIWRSIGTRFLTIAEEIEFDLPNKFDAEGFLSKVKQQLDQNKASADVSYEDRIAFFEARAKLFTDKVFLKQHTKQWNDLLDSSNQLLEKQIYLVGDDYTLADLYASVYLFVTHRRLYANIFANRPHLERYYQRQLKRPSFAQAFFKY